MRILAAVASALRTLVMVPVLVWESGKWILRSVAGVRPDPVLPAAEVAEDYLAETATTPTAPRYPTVDGVPARSPTGVTLVRHARHMTMGDPVVDVSGLPEELQTWLASLSVEEMTRLAVTAPYEAEGLAQGAIVPGLPPLRPTPPVPHADMSTPMTDASAPWTGFLWPDEGKPGDREMIELLTYIEEQERQRKVA